MRSSHTQVLSFYFRSFRFWGAFAFSSFTLALFLPFIMLNNFSNFGRIPTVFTTLVCAACLGLSLGAQLKALTAPAIAAMMPGGRKVPFIALCDIALFYIVIVLVLLTQNASIEPFGLFSVLCLTLSFCMLIGYLQRAYLLAAPLFVYLFASIPQLNLVYLPFRGFDLGEFFPNKLFLLVVSAAMMGILAKNVLLISIRQPAGRPGTWPTTPSLSKSNIISYPPLIKASLCLYPQRDIKPSDYPTLSFLAKIRYWQGAMNIRNNPVYMIMLLVLISLPILLMGHLQSSLFSSDEHFPDAAKILPMARLSNYGMIVGLLYYLPGFQLWWHLKDRLRFSALEAALPLSRRDYIRTEVCALLLAVGKTWLWLLAVCILLTVCFNPSDFKYPLIWLGIAYCTLHYLLFLFALICVIAPYTRQYLAFFVVVSLVVAETTISKALRPLVHNNPIPDTAAQFLPVSAAIVHLLLAIVLAWAAYHKWLKADLALITVSK